MPNWVNANYGDSLLDDLKLPTSFKEIHKKCSNGHGCYILKCHWVKTHYIVHIMLSQGTFCKILKFVIGYVIKYSWLGWKMTQHYNVIYNIITLYEFHR